MLRRYWLAILIAGVLVSSRPHQEIRWDRGATQEVIALERSGGDTFPGPLIYSTPFHGQTPDGRPGLLPTGPLAPGDAVHRALVVRNPGAREVALTTLSAELTLESGRLAESVQVVVTADAAGAKPVARGSLAQFIARPQALAGGGINLRAGESVTLHIWLTLPPSLGRAVRPVVSFGVGAEER